MRDAVPAPPRTIAPRSFLVFTDTRLAGHDVLQKLVDDGFSEILHTARPKRGIMCRGCSFKLR